MDIRYQKIRDKDDDAKQGEVIKLKNEGKEGQQARLQQELSSSPSRVVASPPSASSSPSHEFSFTISVHPPATTAPADKTKTPPSFAIDLSPADEIFFHGHLLPLHLLSHLPVSPRSSTNSLDSFALPIKELLEDQNQNKVISNNNNSENNSDLSSYHQSNDDETKGRIKSKSFSLFGLPKWRKGCEVQDQKDHERQKRKLKFDVSHVLKRYLRMVTPFLSFRSRRGNMNFQRQSHSFSGNLSFRDKKERLRGRRREYSAPASMWTSPTNSGHLVATGTVPTSTSDSTMEELQAAIQAAIAHCKNSNAMEEKK